MTSALLGGLNGQRERLPKEVVCARRLKQLCDAAVTQMAAQQERIASGFENSGALGAVVEYPNLPDAVTDFIYPKHFGMGAELLEAHMPYISEAAR